MPSWSVCPLVQGRGHRRTPCSAWPGFPNETKIPCSAATTVRDFSLFRNTDENYRNEMCYFEVFPLSLGSLVSSDRPKNDGEGQAAILQAGLIPRQGRALLGASDFTRASCVQVHPGYRGPASAKLSGYTLHTGNLQVALSHTQRQGHLQRAVQNSRTRRRAFPLIRV